MEISPGWPTGGSPAVLTITFFPSLVTLNQFPATALRGKFSAICWRATSVMSETTLHCTTPTARTHSFSFPFSSNAGALFSAVELKSGAFSKSSRTYVVHLFVSGEPQASVMDPAEQATGLRLAGYAAFRLAAVGQ